MKLIPPLHFVCFTALVFFLTASAGAAEIKPKTATSTLYWTNGDSLAGKIESATGEDLTWKSPFFVDPLTIDLEMLSAIRMPGEQNVPPNPDSFRIVMRNGDVLFGNITSVTDDLLQFSSTRHGELALKRDSVRSLRQMHNPSLIYLGPRGREGWTKTYKDEPAANAWEENNDGSITTSSRAGMFHKFNFPEKCEIEIILESKKRPAFILVLGKNRTDCLRLETWEDSLVALSGYDFVEAGQIKEDQHKVHLRLFLDTTKKELAVYSQTGEQLATLDGSKSKSLLSGLLLENQEGDLTLSYLRVDQWNGVYPQPLQEGQNRVQLADGSIQYGDLGTIDAENKTITIKSESGANQIPLDQLTTVVVTEGEDQKSTHSQALVSWNDGGFVTGDVVSMSNNSVTVQTDYSEMPIVSSFTGLEKFSLPGGKQPEGEPDTLYFVGGELQGRLIIDGSTTSAPVRWMPVGGKNSSALNSSSDAKFVRGNSGDDIAFNADRFPDVLYFENGDVIPCRVDSVADEIVQIESPFSQLTQVPVADVKAVEFSSTGRDTRQGFRDEGWKRLNGFPKLEDDKLVMGNNCVYGHPNILTGDQIEFQLDWKNQIYGTFLVSLYTDPAAQLDQDCTTIAIHVNNNNIWAKEHKQTQQNMNLHFGFNNAQPENMLADNDRSVNVKLLLKDGKVAVMIDDKELETIPLKLVGNVSRGLRFQSSIVEYNNNRVRVLGLNGRRANNKDVSGFTVSNFLMQNISGTTVKQFIVNETRERTLTIPRFRRDDPPTHVVIAPNGDLLRGRLLGIDSDVIRFESKLEAFRFAKDRIAALIWLKPEKNKSETEEAAKEGEDKEQPATEVTEKNDSSAVEKGMQLRLTDGYYLTMFPESAEGDRLIGSSPKLGVCTIPVSAISELFIGSPQEFTAVRAYAEWVPLNAPEPKWDIPEPGDNPGTQELIGETMVSFDLPALDGTTWKLEDHQDKVIVLDFWATWCGPCVKALPDYIEATANYDPEKVIFVAVNLRESTQQVRKFLETQEYEEPKVIFDQTGDIATRFGVSGIPHTVVLSPGMVVKHISVGYRENGGDLLREKIEQILYGDQAP